MSDSELEFFEPERKPKTKRKSASRSKESIRAGSSKKPRHTGKLQETLDILGLLSEDEESVAAENARRSPARNKQLDSSISNRVANGCVVRRTLLDGPYYVETRVYTTEDALTTSPELRYTKALVTLKAQLDRDQPEWACLQKFLQKTKSSLFADSKPIFYSNKK
ncbi:uncharacterized protein LOC135086140 [Ostrinia nubilalis]|uniref:uncharacterized protein LOC135086140 n=1 Tax=Ostrinia nubilalis TaxID=29057 RepID=UPI00308246B1